MTTIFLFHFTLSRKNFWAMFESYLWKRWSNLYNAALDFPFLWGLILESRVLLLSGTILLSKSNICITNIQSYSLVDKTWNNVYYLVCDCSQSDNSGVINSILWLLQKQNKFWLKTTSSNLDLLFLIFYGLKASVKEKTSFVLQIFFKNILRKYW